MQHSETTYREKTKYSKPKATSYIYLDDGQAIEITTGVSNGYCATAAKMVRIEHEDGYKMVEYFPFTCGYTTLKKQPMPRVTAKAVWLMHDGVLAEHAASDIVAAVKEKLKTE